MLEFFGSKNVFLSQSVAGFLQLLGLFLKHTQKNLRALQDFGIGVLGLVDRLVVLKRKIRAR